LRATLLRTRQNNDFILGVESQRFILLTAAFHRDCFMAEAAPAARKAPSSARNRVSNCIASMWCKPARLRFGYSHSTMTNDERMQRESNLIATIRKELPEFAKACADDTELVLLHQDAFAADYQEDEYTLLGMAIKYAGLRGKEVRVIGKNRSTLGEEEKIQ
jgi:hypothetical protein